MAARRNWLVRTERRFPTHFIFYLAREVSPYLLVLHNIVGLELDTGRWPSERHRTSSLVVVLLSALGPWASLSSRRLESVPLCALLHRLGMVFHGLGHFGFLWFCIPGYHIANTGLISCSRQCAENMPDIPPPEKLK